MQDNDYIDSTTTLRSTWISDNGEMRKVYEPRYMSDPKNLQKKVDDLLTETGRLRWKLTELRTVVERGLDCKFTYERINKPFGIGQMSGECIDAYNALQQIMKDYDKMFGGDHITDANKCWGAS